MKRKIIKINRDLCNGCGLCCIACHEGAIGMQDGKAVLLREDYCDGLGDCLPACPTGAICFEEREAAAYDKQAVERHLAKQSHPTLSAGCTGSAVKNFTQSAALSEKDTPAFSEKASPSALGQWPVQIKLVPVSAPYFEHCHLLIAADCTAYAYASFQERFIKGRITLIGCPKLDSVDYAQKLTDILSQHKILSITVCKMEVPCCTGLANAVQQAVLASGISCPVTMVTISTDGDIL